MDINVKNFFMFRKIKGRRPSESLVLNKGIAKHHPHRQDTVKVHVLNGHGTFRILVLVCEIGDFLLREQELKAQCYILFRENR